MFSFSKGKMEIIIPKTSYAFDELNLYRLTALIPEYNAAAGIFFRRFGFVEEVRRRKALERDARRWDLLHYGLLAKEWKERQI